MRRRRSPHLRQGGRRPRRAASLHVWPGLSPLNMSLHSSSSYLLGCIDCGRRHGRKGFAGAGVQRIDVTWVPSARLTDNGDWPIGRKNVICYSRSIRGRAFFSESYGIGDDGLDFRLDFGLVGLRHDVLIGEISVETFDGVLSQPLFAQLFGDIIGLVSLRVPADAESFAFDQRGAFAAASVFASAL